jgi:hypothetical protein
MGIEADENRPDGIDGQVLHKCRGWPSDGHADVHGGEFSAVVLDVPSLYFDVSHAFILIQLGDCGRRAASPGGCKITKPSTTTSRAMIQQMTQANALTYAAG